MLMSIASLNFALKSTEAAELIIILTSFIIVNSSYADKLSLFFNKSH